MPTDNIEFGHYPEREREKSRPKDCAQAPLSNAEKRDLHGVPSVFIELTSKCNMDCKFCPYAVCTREKKDMKHEHVCKILDELKNFKADVTFHVLGEPLLNKHFFEYADLCESYGIQWWLVTNGLQFTPKVNARLFSYNKLGLVEISYHTMSPETLKRLRGVKSLCPQKYLDKIKSAVFCENRYLKGTKIRLDIMYDLHLYHEHLWQGFNYEDWYSFMDVMSSWAQELNALYPDAKERYPKYYYAKKQIFKKNNHITYRKREDIPGKFFEAGSEDVLWIDWEIFPNVFATLKKFFIFAKDKAYLDCIFEESGHSVKIEPCSNFDSCDIANTLIVLSNGDISFCCLDYEGKLSCGNIAQMSLEEAALSEKRKLLLSRPSNFSECRACRGEIILSKI